MAVAIIMAVFMSIVMIGIGSFILYPVMDMMVSTSLYTDLPQQYQVKIDQSVLVTASLPILMMAVVIIWAFLRASKKDQISY